jgi:hypothetical protein
MVELSDIVRTRTQVSRGVHLKPDSPAAATVPARQVPALSSSELGGDIILGAPTATQ